jgi:hypothetical protein
MGGAVPSLPQYAFMAWCSVRGSTGTTLPLLLPYLVTLAPFEFGYYANATLGLQGPGQVGVVTPVTFIL